MSEEIIELDYTPTNFVIFNKNNGEINYLFTSPAYNVEDSFRGLINDDLENYSYLVVVEPVNTSEYYVDIQTLTILSKSDFPNLIIENNYIGNIPENTIIRHIPSRNIIDYGNDNEINFVVNWTETITVKLTNPKYKDLYLEILCNGGI